MKLAVLIAEGVFELIFDLVMVNYLSLINIFRLLAWGSSFIIVRCNIKIASHLSVKIIMDSWMAL